MWVMDDFNKKSENQINLKLEKNIRDVRVRCNDLMFL